MSETTVKNSIIESYEVLVDYLADLLGSNCEVVLHEIKDGISIIRKIRNNHISGRDAGKKTDDIGIRIPKADQDMDYIVNNYENSPTGLEIKTNTFLIKTQEKEIIGMLCINFDLSLPLLARSCIDNFLGEFSTCHHSEKTAADVRMKSTAQQNGEQDIFKSLSREIIEEVIRANGISVKRMTPNERVHILGKMKERGVFRIKYAVRDVAKALSISEPSVYRYLKDLE